MNTSLDNFRQKEDTWGFMLSSSVALSRSQLFQSRLLDLWKGPPPPDNSRWFEIRSVAVGLSALKPSPGVTYDDDYIIMVLRLFTGHANLPFSLSGENAHYYFPISVSQSPCPVKFLQAACGQSPDEHHTLGSGKLPKARHNSSNAWAVRSPLCADLQRRRRGSARNNSGDA